MRVAILFSFAAVSFALGCGGATAPSLDVGDASGDALGDDIAEAGLDAARVDGGDWRGDGGAIGDASKSDASSHDTPCGPQTCKGETVCVVLTAGGGPCYIPQDGGACPNGQPYTGGCCDNTTTSYSCKPLPADCHGSLACPCASPLCQCGGCQIADAGVLACACEYP